MYLKNLLGSLILFVSLSACAGNAKESNSLLWKVSGNGLDAPSYLFGTHHLVPVSFLDEIEGLEDAFNSSQQVIGELDMSRMQSMQMQIIQKAMLPGEYDYKTLLGDDDYKLLEDKVAEVIGMSFDQLGRMKPAMINNLMMISLYQQYYPTAVGKGIDEHFQDEARKRDMNVVGLETADDQIYVLLEMQSIERQAEVLMCSLKHPELLKEQMDKLQTAYHAQDLAALDALYNEKNEDDPCPSTDEEKYELNDARNQKWLALLPEMMQSKPSFVAVGCLHLVGDNGLVEGLRKAGYKVEAVR